MWWLDSSRYDYIEGFSGYSRRMADAISTLFSTAPNVAARAHHERELGRRGAIRGAVGAGILVAAYALFPRVPIQDAVNPIVAGLLLTIVYAGVLLTSVGATDLLRGTAPAVLVLPLAAVALIAIGTVTWPSLGSVGRILLAVAAGVTFSLVLDRLSTLLWLAIAVSAVDLWSVFAQSGISRRLVEDQGQSTVFDVLAIYLPALGSREPSFVGTVDFAFIGLVVAIVVQWQLGLVRVLVSLTASLLAFDGLHRLAGDLAVLPALPFLCLGLAVGAWPYLVAGLNQRTARLGRRHATRA